MPPARTRPLFTPIRIRNSGAESALHVLRIAGEVLLDRQGGMEGPDGVVLFSQRRAEEGHHAVAGEGVHPAPVALHLPGEQSEAPVHHLVDDLRIEPLRQRSETDDIGKQDGDLPALALHRRRGHQRRRLRPQRRATTPAEPLLGLVGEPARRALREEWSAACATEPPTLPVRRPATRTIHFARPSPNDRSAGTSATSSVDVSVRERHARSGRSPTPSVELNWPDSRQEGGRVGGWVVGQADTAGPNVLGSTVRRPAPRLLAAADPRGPRRCAAYAHRRHIGSPIGLRTDATRPGAETVDMRRPGRPPWPSPPPSPKCRTRPCRAGLNWPAAADRPAKVHLLLKCQAAATWLVPLRAARLHERAARRRV